MFRPRQARENVTSCGIPAVSVNDAAGEELIPFGNPLAVTVTVPVNPFTGIRETRSLVRLSHQLVWKPKQVRSRY